MLIQILILYTEKNIVVTIDKKMSTIVNDYFTKDN